MLELLCNVEQDLQVKFNENTVLKQELIQAKEQIEGLKSAEKKFSAQ
jgi:hypothetical protein